MILKTKKKNIKKFKKKSKKKFGWHQTFIGGMETGSGRSERKRSVPKGEVSDVEPPPEKRAAVVSEKAKNNLHR